MDSAHRNDRRRLASALSLTILALGGLSCTSESSARTMASECVGAAARGSIFFLSTRAGKTTNIYRMDDNGTRIARVTDTRLTDRDVAISPDGSTMLFSRADSRNRMQLYRMNLESARATNVSRNRFSDSDPSWSPDGNQVVFESDRTGKPELWLMRPDGSHLKQLTANGAENGDADWSPDGRKIVFESHADGKSDVYVINADGSGRSNLTPGTPDSYDADPRWSPDGWMIAFKSDRSRPGRGKKLGTYQVYVMNADGSGLKRVTHTTADESEPAWSADGTRLVFNSDLSGNTEIYTIDLNGKHRTRLTHDHAYDGYPYWTRPAQQAGLRNASPRCSQRNATGVAVSEAAASPATGRTTAGSPTYRTSGEKLESRSSKQAGSIPALHDPSPPPAQIHTMPPASPAQETAADRSPEGLGNRGLRPLQTGAAWASPRADHHYRPEKSADC